MGLSAEAPPTNERSSGSKGGRAPGLCAFSQGSGPRGQGQGVRPAPGASARPWPMGATASEAAFGQRTRMLPFSPETRARGRAAKAPRTRPDGGLCSRPPGQHRPCLREPGQGGLTSCGPQATGSPACPTGRGRVRRLPPVPPAWAWSGQGLSLWRKQRGVCRVEKMPQAETSREQEMARGQVPGLHALGRTCTAPGGSKLQTEATGGPGTRCRC